MIYKMIKIKCHHCGHEWNYKGKSEFYAPCPKCMYKVNIKKNKLKNGDREVNNK